MQTPQTIAVIGAAAIGKGITRGLACGRDKIILCDTDFDAIQSFTKELQAQRPGCDVEALHCSYEATWEADIIVLALESCPDRREIAKKINVVASQKIDIIVDDGVQELEQLLPHSRIVRAFYNMDPEKFNGSDQQPQNMDCYVSGRDPEAVQMVAALVQSMGLNPVVVPGPATVPGL